MVDTEDDPGGLAPQAADYHAGRQFNRWFLMLRPSFDALTQDQGRTENQARRTKDENAAYSPSASARMANAVAVSDMNSRRHGSPFSPPCSRS